MLTVSKQAEKITAVVMETNRKMVITFDLQLYEMAVKLQLHEAPELGNMIFCLVTSLQALGTSIEESGFDDA